MFVDMEIDNHQIVFNGDAITLHEENEHDFNFDENNWIFYAHLYMYRHFLRSMLKINTPT